MSSPTCVSGARWAQAPGHGDLDQAWDCGPRLRRCRVRIRQGGANTTTHSPHMVCSRGVATGQLPCQGHGARRLWESVSTPGIDFCLSEPRHGCPESMGSLMGASTPFHAAWHPLHASPFLVPRMVCWVQVRVRSRTCKAMMLFLTRFIRQVPDRRQHSAKRQGGVSLCPPAQQCVGLTDAHMAQPLIICRGPSTPNPENYKIHLHRAILTFLTPSVVSNLLLRPPAPCGTKKDPWSSSRIQETP